MGSEMCIRDRFMGVGFVQVDIVLLCFSTLLVFAKNVHVGNGCHLVGGEHVLCFSFVFGVHGRWLCSN